jgi:hypothetical protein
LVAQTCRLLDVIGTVDRDDLAISARKGVVTVRRGKGERYRQVPLNAEVRDALDAWLDKRADLPGSNGPALFLSVQRRRLSTRAIDLALRRLGQQADVELSAHTLRHTDAATVGWTPTRPKSSGSFLPGGRNSPLELVAGLVLSRPPAHDRPGRPAPAGRAGHGAASALDRVREVARRDKGARFTALLHHVDGANRNCPELLTETAHPERSPE